MRIEISAKSEYGEPREAACRRSVHAACGIAPTFVRVVDVYIVSATNLEPQLQDALVQLFVDPVAQNVAVDRSKIAERHAFDWDLLAEVTYRPGVTDPEALTAREAIERTVTIGIDADTLVQVGTQYLLGFPDEAASSQAVLALHNPLIQLVYTVSAESWSRGERPPTVYDHGVPPSAVVVDRVSLGDCGAEELEELSRKRLLALDLAEMQAIQAYFAETEIFRRRTEIGIGSEATDVELEMIAQTWSEHCKHKIFQASIDYHDGSTTTRIDGLFGSFIRRLTDEVGQGKGYLRSVFTDNSGVVAFDDSCLLCFKAETHNSPSALDPYGGAITGIVGVNRDIMGTGKGARPIFNTDVLCFGYPQTDGGVIPSGILHPRTVMAGVHKGIIDGGNQSGIPAAAGAFLFDESYTGKPLVYCGTGGIMPQEIDGEAAWLNHVDPGDIAVMVGGRIGKDGIHGATFSSLDLSETSPTSAVQIGDPITQRKMLDFLLEARDAGLYKGITDNGAGGLSSSLGEMAERSGGVVINLDRCPLKYPGLAPWEILVSESQERMSLAVDPSKIEALAALAGSRGVEISAVGTFTDSGRVEVYYEDDLVASVDLHFLHDGVPQMRLSARWIPPDRRFEARADRTEAQEWLSGLDDSGARLRDKGLAVLSDPNIRSKEPLVRQYDHEVQGRSVTKPFCGTSADGPTDGGVLRIGERWGITVTHGICPRYGDWDTYDMAACAVDEAMRAHVALGGDPTVVAALDNFCWPNPIAALDNPDGEYKLAQLVRANQGLYDTCKAYGIPLISGKDSMKNDSTIGGKKLSVRPTLLVSLMGHVADVGRTVTTDLKHPGNLLCLIGVTKHELGGSALERRYLHDRNGVSPWDEDRGAPPFGKCPKVDTESAMRRFEALYEAISRGLCASVHDLSDGGLFVALSESAIGGRCGASVDLREAGGTLATSAALFSESASRFLVEVLPGNLDQLRTLLGEGLFLLGTVQEAPVISITRDGDPVLDLPLEVVTRAWKGGDEAW